MQTVDQKDWSGLTTENHLNAIYAREPSLVNDMIELAFKVNLGNDIVGYMDRFPTMYIDDDVPFGWLIQGHDEKNIPLLGYYDQSLSTAPTKPGIAHSVFYLEFGERYFNATEVIVGEKPDLYKMRIVGDPISSGTSYFYPVQLVTGDETLFVPTAELATSKRFSKEYALTEQTLSRRGGGLSFTSPYRLENVLSQIRIEYEVPGNMIRMGKNKPMKMSWVDPVTKKVMSTWLGYLDWVFLTQFRRQKARLLKYGNSNKKADGTFGNIGDSGYEIRAGFGIDEQVAPSNILYFNKFSLDWLCQVALGLSVGKLPEDERRFVLSTGEYGAYDFHVAASNSSTLYTPNQTSQRIRMTGDGKMTYMGQFVEYHWVNGIKFAIHIDPMKDDPIRNKLPHPDGGLASSHAFDIWDFGTTGGEPSIQKVALKGDEEIYKYINGIRDPFTPYNNQVSPTQAVSPVDGYKVIKQFIGGARVKNPMNHAKLIPDILA